MDTVPAYSSMESRLKMHIYRVWAERLLDDEIFEENKGNGSEKGDIKSISEDLSSPTPKLTHVVSEDNLVEFMEALDI